MDEELRKLLEDILKTLGGLERRRRMEDVLDERIRTLELRRDRGVRSAILAVAGLAVAIAVAVNVAFHYFWR